jgi:alkylhydroperoxidase/carboxymuconolactone decarboxylase family protein YurZ
MKLQSAAIALLSLMVMPSARTEEIATMIGSNPVLTHEDVRQVAPPLAAYTQNRLLRDLWKRPGLAPRDRSIVTLVALIARGNFRHAQVPARSWGRYGEPREHSAVVDFKLLVNVVEVHFNGTVGNIQLPRNCLVR